MEIVENMEDLLTIDLSEVEKKEIEKSYTESEKYLYSLMFTDGSQELKAVLNAPIMTEEATKARAEERKRIEIKNNKETLEEVKRLKKIEKSAKKEELQAKKAEKEELKKLAELLLHKVDETVESPIDLKKVESKVKKEPKYKGNFSYRLTFTKSAELFNSTSTKEKKVAKVDKIIATEDEKPYLEAINDLYILTRNKYLNMNSDATYFTIQPKSENANKYVLVDSVIIQHLRQEKTIGVFAGEQLTKFICFDIDNSNDLETSKRIAKDVIDVLVNIFKIDKEYIVTSFSGNKGYHVEVFFEKTVDKSEVKRLYNAVLPHLNPFEGSLVELRPTRQGLKVPLSVHKRTGKVCNFVDIETFEEVGRERILSIKKMPIESFKKIMNNKRLFTLSTKKAEEMEKLISEVKPLNKTKTQKETNIVSILSEGKLVRPHSRHDVTFKGAAFLFSQGQLLDDAIFILKEVMDNTFLNARHLIDATTTRKIAYDDIEKTTKYVYQNNIVLADSKPEIVVYQSEMEHIFNLPKMHLKVLAFSILQHAKKFAKQNGEFFMTYSSMSEMGNDQNRQRLLNSILLLQEAGFLKIVSRNVISEGLSIEYGRIMSEPNHYKLTIPAPTNEEPFITLNTNKKIDFVKVAPKLINRATLKSKTTPHVFKKYFK